MADIRVKQYIFDMARFSFRGLGGSYKDSVIFSYLYLLKSGKIMLFSLHFRSVMHLVFAILNPNKIYESS